MWYAGLWTTSSTSAASAASTSRSSTPTWSSSTALIPDQPAPSSSEISSRVEHWTMMMMNIFRDSNGNFLVAGRSKAISTKHFTHCPCFQNLKLKLLHLKQIYINESRLCHYLFYIERSSYNSRVLCVSAIFWLSIFLLSSNLSYLCNQKSQSYWLSICRIYLSVSLSFFIYLSILGVLIAAWWWTTCRSTGSTVTTRTTRLSSTTASWRLSGIRRTQEPGGKTYFRSPGKPLDEKKNVRRITGVFPTDINRTDYGFCLEISIEYKFKQWPAGK